MHYLYKIIYHLWPLLLLLKQTRFSHSIRISSVGIEVLTERVWTIFTLLWSLPIVEMPFPLPSKQSPLFELLLFTMPTLRPFEWVRGFTVALLPFVFPLKKYCMSSTGIEVWTSHVCGETDAVVIGAAVMATVLVVGTVVPLRFCICPGTLHFTVWQPLSIRPSVFWYNWRNFLFVANIVQ